MKKFLYRLQDLLFGQIIMRGLYWILMIPIIYEIQRWIGGRFVGGWSFARPIQFQSRRCQAEWDSRNQPADGDMLAAPTWFGTNRGVWQNGIAIQVVQPEGGKPGELLVKNQWGRWLSWTGPITRPNLWLGKGHEPFLWCLMTRYQEFDSKTKDEMDPEETQFL